MLLQKIVPFQKPYKNAIFSVLGTKLRTKGHVFYSRKCNFHSAFDISVTQSIPTGNEQMMKSRLRTCTLIST